MPQDAAQIEMLLREHGCLLTPQRRAIVQALLKPSGHLTAAELLGEITGAFPMASRATVYSTLALLRELGALSEIHLAGAEIRYDANPEPHQHFACTECGGLEDVPDSWLPVTLAVPRGGFRVTRFRVIAEGVCAACL